MDISYDPAKNKELLLRRGIGFEEVKNIFVSPYFVDSRGRDYPEQSYAVGIYNGKLWTVIFEDDLGHLRWLITFWPSTPKEKRKYYNA